MVKSNAYKAVGQLCTRIPALFANNLSLLKAFFNAFKEDGENSVHVALQGESRNMRPCLDLLFFKKPYRIYVEPSLIQTTPT